MPYSSVEGKGFVRDFFQNVPIDNVLDIGPGAGVWPDVLAGEVGSAKGVGVWWTAVEIWAPYISEFRLHEKYDEVIVADAFYLNWNLLDHQDLTILGDVIEHMHYDDALAVIEAAVSRSTWVVISVPIIHYPQGTVGGNTYEAHLHHYSRDNIDELLLCGYNVVARHEGDVVGVYIIKGKLED